MRERQSALVNDARHDSRFYSQIDAIAGSTTRSVLAVPLTFKGAVWGVVETINKTSGPFTEQDREMLEALAASTAIAIENARLYEAEQKQFKRLQQSQAQLIQAEKIAALGRLTASIAHEINNPLQTVQGNLELAVEALEGELRQDRLARYLGTATTELERIRGIVQRMREFSRPARDERRAANVQAVVESVLQLAGKQLQHSRVTVEREWTPDLPFIQANPDHLKQVFLNLVLNAIDAMPEGGSLRVSTCLDHLHQGDLRTLAIRIEFRDSGEGIPPELLPRIFEPFVTAKANGTGLGLAISYEIIQAHQGVISATSEPGKGSTFAVLLPVTASS